ncbi:MAG TPA: hypothetical protein VFK06_18990 [Candidatus Angelobacter sp.]|nr:hypothetical protein [Candidatus Angelobacter sp.]
MHEAGTGAAANAPNSKFEVVLILITGQQRVSSLCRLAFGNRDSGMDNDILAA